MFKSLYKRITIEDKKQAEIIKASSRLFDIELEIEFLESSRQMLKKRIARLNQSVVGEHVEHGEHVGGLTNAAWSEFKVFSKKQAPI